RGEGEGGALSGRVRGAVLRHGPGVCQGGLIDRRGIAARGRETAELAGHAVRRAAEEHRRGHVVDVDDRGVLGEAAVLVDDAGTDRVVARAVRVNGTDRGVVAAVGVGGAGQGAAV